MPTPVGVASYMESECIMVVVARSSDVKKLAKLHLNRDTGFVLEAVIGVEGL